MVSSKFGHGSKPRGTPPICKKPPPLPIILPLPPPPWPADQIPWNMDVQYTDPAGHPHTHTWNYVLPKVAAFTYHAIVYLGPTAYGAMITLDIPHAKQFIWCNAIDFPYGSAFQALAHPLNVGSIHIYNRSAWDYTFPSGATCQATWTL
jgi:hypothetical protein